MKDLNFSPRSIDSLNRIEQWTTDHFGPSQSEAYLDAILARCNAIVLGRANCRSCRAVFAENLREDLQFTRSGQHYIVFVDAMTAILIVDFIHSSADLPRRLALIGP